VLEARPPFRRRLLVALGVALALSLAVVGVLTWAVAAAWTTHEARSVLRAEVLAVESASVTSTGVDPERYDWDEPHHRFASPRIDPFFLQVFDADDRLVHASDNVAALAGYPAGRLAWTDGDGPFTPLARLRLGGHRLYRVTEPLRDRDGRAAGAIQIARFDPGVGTTLGRLAAGLAAGLGVLLAALLGLVWAVGTRVVRPLEAITRRATALSATTLGEPIPVPDDADRETAALATALNGALDRLDRSFAEMQRFTSNAAHELQTPLTILRGHVDVTLRRERQPDVYRDTLRLLRDEVDALTHTVRGLLALARLDVGSALDMARIDLADLAEGAAEARRPAAEAKGLDLDVDVASACVEGHADLLRDVVLNLVDNAIKYTDAGRVAVRVRQGGGQARLLVEDSGRGIPAEHLGRVTDRFWRADDVQQVPGSGLGLAIVAGIVERHGGRLAVAAAPGGGTRVEVSIPAAS